MPVRASQKALPLTIVGMTVTALLLTGCGTPQPFSQSQPVPAQTQEVQPATGENPDGEYVEVCQDTETEQRVEDEKCQDENRPVHYVPTYYPYNSVLPSIGAAMLVGYLMSPPRKSTVYRGAAPRTGGYAPTTRPNSNFLKVPDDFVGGVPTTAPRNATPQAPGGTAATKAPSTKQETAPKKATPKKATPKKKFKIKTRRR